MTRPFALLIVVGAILPFTGCGGGMTPVTGVVTLDGKPLAEATVTFISEDGKTVASGQSDDTGTFTLTSGNAPGAFPGTYKVTVTKYPKVVGMSPGLQGGGGMDKDYLNNMKKEMSKMGVPGGAGAKVELPAVYAAIEKTPLTCKVPADGPVKLELKSKP